MYAEERQQAMAQLVAERGRLSVAVLAGEYDVTTETVRRDLSALERMGLVRRVHGGAIPANSLAVIESALVERDRANVDAKDAIAKCALSFLPPPGGTVVLDAGSTTARLVAHLPREHQLTVFTHAVPLAARLTTCPQVELNLLPGRVRATTQAAVGADTVAALGALRVDVAILGSNGLSLSHGLSTPDPDEAATKTAMVRAARQVVALVDSSKLGVESPIRFAALDELDVLVTDAAIDREARTAIEAVGVEVVVAP